jgi:hypothetical protein
VNVGRRFHRAARDFHILLAGLHLAAAIVLWAVRRFRWIAFHLITAIVDCGAAIVHDRERRKT